MAKHENPYRRGRRSLDAVPDALRHKLTTEQRREVADLGADLDRAHRERLRIGLPGGPPPPAYLEAAEAESPGAARLYYALDGRRFTVPGAVAVGRHVGLGDGQARAGLDALRRCELVSGSEPFVTLPPGNVPF